MPRKLKVDQATINHMVDTRYPDEGPDLIAEELGVKPETVRYWACKRKVKVKPEVHQRNRVASLHENYDGVRKDYFNAWTHNMAYILGYIWADGCVEWRPTGNGCLRFYCLKSDRMILDFIRTEMEIRSEVQDATDRVTFEGHELSEMVYLLVSFSPMARQLIDQFNIQPDKTHKDCPFPSYVPDEHLPHFIRGFMDGDGSVSPRSSGENGIRVVFYGTERFLDGLRSELRHRLGLPPVTLSPCKTIKSLTWSSKLDVRTIYDYLYPKTGNYFYLPRKKQCFLDYLA